MGRVHLDQVEPGNRRASWALRPKSLMSAFVPRRSSDQLVRWLIFCCIGARRGSGGDSSAGAAVRLDSGSAP